MTAPALLRAACALLLLTAEAYIPAAARPATRRSLLGWAGAAATAAAVPPRAGAVEVGETTPFNSMCLGFGCNAVTDLKFNGAPAPDTGEPSLTMAQFLKAVDVKEVAKLDMTDRGNTGYVTLKDGRRLLVGEGWPVESAMGWSDPLWVIRICQDRDIPYTYELSLKGAKSMAESERSRTKTSLKVS